MFTIGNKKVDFFHFCPSEIFTLSHLVNENLVTNFNRFDSIAFEVKNLTNLPFGKVSIFSFLCAIPFSVADWKRGEYPNIFFVHPYNTLGYNVVLFLQFTPIAAEQMKTQGCSACLKVYLMICVLPSF